MRSFNLLALVFALPVLSQERCKTQYGSLAVSPVLSTTTTALYTDTLIKVVVSDATVTSTPKVTKTTTKTVDVTTTFTTTIFRTISLPTGPKTHAARSVLSLYERDDDAAPTNTLTQRGHPTYVICTTTAFTTTTTFKTVKGGQTTTVTGPGPVKTKTVTRRFSTTITVAGSATTTG